MTVKNIMQSSLSATFTVCRSLIKIFEFECESLERDALLNMLYLLLPPSFLPLLLYSAPCIYMYCTIFRMLGNQRS